MVNKNNGYSVIYSDDDIVVLNKSSGVLIAQDRYNPLHPALIYWQKKNSEDYLQYTVLIKILPV